MKKYPAIGNELLSLHPLYPAATSAVTEHHRRINGKGYLQGFDGDTIYHIARIMTIVNAFDAMAGSRPYRKSAE